MDTWPSWRLGVALAATCLVLSACSSGPEPALGSAPPSATTNGATAPPELSTTPSPGPTRPVASQLRGLGSSATWWSQAFTPTAHPECTSDFDALTALAWSGTIGVIWCSVGRDELRSADGSNWRDALTGLELHLSPGRTEREVLDLVEEILPTDAEYVSSLPGVNPGYSGLDGNCLSVAYHSETITALNESLFAENQYSEGTDVDVVLYSGSQELDGASGRYNPYRIREAYINSSGAHVRNRDGTIPC